MKLIKEQIMDVALYQDGKSINDIVKNNILETNVYWKIMKLIGLYGWDQLGGLLSRIRGEVNERNNH